MTKDICCLGHITRDVIITPEHTVNMAGGTAFYFGYAMSRLGGDVAFSLLTKIGRDDMHVVDDMRRAGIDVDARQSRQTVVFENKYGEDSNQRTQRVLATADPFTLTDIEGLSARHFHIGSLLATDFPVEVVQALAARGSVSIDAQGYLREVRSQHVHTTPWRDKESYLRCATVLQMDENEIMATAGTDEADEAASRLAAMGVREVIITLGSHGSMIYADGRRHDIPAYKPRQTVDTTGCGDTYSAGYLYARAAGAGIDEAGRFAAAMCSLKIERTGPFGGTIDDIRLRMGS